MTKHSDKIPQYHKDKGEFCSWHPPNHYAVGDEIDGYRVRSLTPGKFFGDPEMTIVGIDPLAAGQR